MGVVAAAVGVIAGAVGLGVGPGVVVVAVAVPDVVRDRDAGSCWLLWRSSAERGGPRGSLRHVNWIYYCYYRLPHQNCDDRHGLFCVLARLFL